MDVTQLVVQGGIGGVMIVSIILFIRYISSRDKSDCAREERMETFLTNHLSTYTRSMDIMAQELREMRHSVNKCPHNKEAAARPAESKE